MLAHLELSLRCQSLEPDPRRTAGRLSVSASRFLLSQLASVGSCRHPIALRLLPTLGASKLQRRFLAPKQDRIQYPPRFHILRRPPQVEHLSPQLVQNGLHASSTGEG